MSFKRAKKEDSFAQWFINEFGQDKFDKIINHQKNKELGLDIWSISKRSLAKIWFFCENKDYHEYCLSADGYYKGNRCKWCGRTKFIHPKDSLGQYIINNYGQDFLNKIWSDKNDKSPFKYSIGTEKKVWFNCINNIHEEHSQQIKNAVRQNFRCPECEKYNNTSKLQHKVEEYLKELGYGVNKEYNCSLLIKNPKTKYPLPFDNEIILQNGIHIFIEINGRQHYEEIGQTSKWLHGKTPNQYLHDRQLIDRYKKIKAIQNNYEYLEIPYWDEKNDNYKNKINNKINNILPVTTEMKEHHFRW